MIFSLIPMLLAGALLAPAGAGISTDSLRFKEGTESYRWDYSPQSECRFVAGQPFQVDSAALVDKGISLWVYNPAPSGDSLVFRILDSSGDTAFVFPFRLRSRGWRACWCSLENMQRCKDSPEGICSFVVTAPGRSGTVWLDRVTFPVMHANPRTTPDLQMPYNNMGKRPLWHWCRTLEWSQNEYPTPVPTSLTRAQTADIRRVRAALASHLKIGKAIPKAIEAAEAVYSRSGIRELPDGGFAGAPLVDPDELIPGRGEFTLKDLETMLYGFALDAFHNGSSTSRDRYFQVWRYAVDQGFAPGSGMGTNHHYGYKIRNIFASVHLMREDILSSPYREDIVETVRYWSALGETCAPYEKGLDGIIDAWNTLLLPKLVAALLTEDECWSYRALQYLSAWVSDSLAPSPGTTGGFKEDGTGFHHGGFYPAYTSGAVASLGKYVSIVSGTAFQLSTEARLMLKSALQTMRNYCNATEWGIGLSGRHPFSGRMTPEDIQAFASLSLAGDLSGKGDRFDRELASDYLRLCNAPTREARRFIAAGVKPAAAPSGFFVYNTGAAAIFRGGDWMVTLKGYNSDVWGAEIYVKDNRYGRYQSYGSAQIFSRKGREESGYSPEGWDWNRLPGVSSIHLPPELLDSPLPKTTMAKSSEDYAGACSLEGDCGVFSMKLSENDLPNFTPDFKAKKSVFCFGNRMICLGTGISNSNVTYRTETTLFQNRASGPGVELFVDAGRNILKDGYGNYYLVPPGNDPLEAATELQASNDEKDRSVNQGVFSHAIINHGTAPRDAAYEYLVLIQADDRQVSSEADAPSYGVQQKDSVAHIVRDMQSGTLGCSFFEDYSGGSARPLLSCTGETLVMLREKSDGTVIVSVCDPSMHLIEKAFTTASESRPVTKELLFDGLLAERGDTAVRCRRSANRTAVTVECRNGRPVEFILSPFRPSGN